MAKKMNFINVAVTVTAIATAVCLASCDKVTKHMSSSSSNATTAQHTQTQDMKNISNSNVDHSMFVATFNSTESFIKRYTDKNFDFNANLPLRLGFTDLLNTLSNSSDILDIVKSDKQRLAELQVLQQLETQFNQVVSKYKAMDPTEVKTMFDKAGISVDFDKANLTTLLDQLKTGCTQNNNYQVNIDQLVKSLVIKDKDGKVVSFPEDEIKMLKSWSQHFAQACDLNSKLYTIASAKGFEYSNLSAQISDLQKSMQDQAAAAMMEKPTADKPMDTTTDNKKAK